MKKLKRAFIDTHIVKKMWTKSNPLSNATLNMLHIYEIQLLGGNDLI